MQVFPGKSLNDVDAYNWRSLFGFGERMGKVTRGFDPLSPLDRGVLRSAERQFPVISREVCPDRNGAICGITGQSCELRSCPKILESEPAASMQRALGG